MNLANALRRLRDLGTRRVWADAVCINQDDNLEKSLQILIIRHIYARAEVTYS